MPKIISVSKVWTKLLQKQNGAVFWDIVYITVETRLLVTRGQSNLAKAAPNDPAQYSRVSSPLHCAGSFGAFVTDRPTHRQTDGQTDRHRAHR